MRALYSLVVVVFILAGLQVSQAQEPTGKSMELQFESPIIVRKGNVSITLADFVAYMDRRIPKEEQREMVASASRIEGILENIALTESFWSRVADRGMLEDPFFRARLYQAAVREARDAYREQMQTEMELDSYQSQARELYLLQPERFTRTKSVDIEHILVSAGEERGEIEAMKRVIEVHERLLSGEDFTAVASEMSDDPTFSDNSGLLEQLEVRSLVPSVASAVDSLEIGELSTPVQSRFGWHVVRLKKVHDAGRLTWEEAKPIAERIARERHLTESFERLLRDINSAPMQFADGAVRTILEHYGADGFGIPELGEGSESDDSAQ